MGEKQRRLAHGVTVSGGARYLEVDGRGIEFDRAGHRSNPDCSLNLPKSPNEEAVREPVSEIPCPLDWAGTSGFPSIWVRICEVSLKKAGEASDKAASDGYEEWGLSLKVISPLDVRRSEVIKVRR